MANWFENVLINPSLRQPPLVIHGPMDSGKTLLINFLKGYYHDRSPRQYYKSYWNDWLVDSGIVIVAELDQIKGSFPGTLIYSETLRLRRKGRPPIEWENKAAWIIEAPRRIDYCVNVNVTRLDRETGYPTPRQAYELGKQHRIDGVRLTIPYVRSVLK